MKDDVFLGFVAILLFFVILAVGVLNQRMTTLHNSLLVTPGQVDSALVEAAYRLLSERDSVIRDCVERLGPLNPECRP